MDTKVSEARVNLYKSTLASLQYVFSKGKVAHFVKHEFKTANAEDIRELDAEVANGHPQIYVDSANKTVSAVEVSPLAAIEARIRAQLKAEMQIGQVTQTQNFQPAQTPQASAFVLPGIATSADMNKEAPGNIGKNLGDISPQNPGAPTQSPSSAQTTLMQKLEAAKQGKPS